MSVLSDIREYSRNFKKHLLQYLVLFLGLDLFSQFVVIPLFRYVSTYLLQASAIPFISYKNIATIITSNTLIFVALVVEVLVLVVLLYLMFAFLLYGIRAISLEQFNFREAFRQVGQAFKRLRVGSLSLFTVYFLLLIPFVDITYRTALLSKIQIPEFILDYMTRNGFLVAFLVTFYVVVGILGFRLILALPFVLLEKTKTWTAVKKSWRLTGSLEWWPLLVKFAVLMAMVIILLAGFYVSFYWLQLICDIFPGKLSEILAVGNLTAIQLISELLLIWSSVVGCLFLFKEMGLKQPQSSRQRASKTLITGTIFALIILVGSSIVENTIYLNGTDAKAPVVISHRGVSEGNGVQNTIPALKKTAKMKPDYVEIDLHETKDKQFIVLHDENLKKLTGVNKTPSELTLKQLTKLTAKENGHSAKLASFDQYLKEAEKLHQKLLIEIKTTPTDSKKMLERFNKKYGKIIIKNHYKVQSLDYRVVKGLHRVNSKLDVMYIQPYNFTYPKGSANGYSMEYSTLNSDFIWQSHLKNHAVYAWTVNDANLMKKMMFNHVDGVISDDIPEVRTAVKDFQHNSTYANRILNYILVIPTHSNLEV